MRKLLDKKGHMSFSFEGQEHVPIEVTILAAFIYYRYKFLSQLPEWTRT